MKIYVKTLIGKTLTIEIEPTQLIEDLKFKIQDTEGIPVDQQRLIFLGKQLMNHHTCEEFGIGQVSHGLRDLTNTSGRWLTSDLPY